MKQGNVAVSRFSRSLLAVGITASFMAPGAWAAPGDRIGGESLVTNSAVVFDRTSFSLARDAAGNFVVAWLDDYQNGNAYFRISARLYASDGTPAGPAFTVATLRESTGIVDAPAVAMDSAGDFVVVWEDYPRGAMARVAAYAGFTPTILARRYTPGGAPAGGVITVTASGRGPAVAMDDDGDFVVGWSTDDISLGLLYGSFPTHLTPYRIRARQYSATGLPRGLPVTIDSEFAPKDSFATYSVRDVAVAIDGAGNAVVGWTRDRSTRNTGSDVFGQRLSKLGLRVGNNFQINDAASSSSHLALSMNARGRLVAAWEAPQLPGMPVQVKVYAEDATVAVPQFSASSAPLSSVFAMNHAPSVAIDAAGNLVVAAGTAMPDSDLNLTNLRLFDPAGTPRTPVLAVRPDESTRAGSLSHVAIDGAGNPAVARDLSFRELTVQRFSGN